MFGTYSTVSYFVFMHFWSGTVSYFVSMLFRTNPTLQVAVFSNCEHVRHAVTYLRAPMQYLLGVVYSNPLNPKP